MNLLAMGLDWDGSLEGQPGLLGQLTARPPLPGQAQEARLWADARTRLLALDALGKIRAQYPKPWLAFTGSGDFHHLTLLLLESLPPPQRPSCLVVIDNHPDWFLESPACHCGNWVGTALSSFPWLKRVILIGGDSPDWAGYRYWRAPWPEICSGKVLVLPFRRSETWVPFRRHSVRHSSLLGTRLTFTPLSAAGVGASFEHVAALLERETVYLSIDKDCLRRDQLVTDWEQGQLTIPQLLEGVEILARRLRLSGADICGEASASPLPTLAKRLDAGRMGLVLPVSQMRENMNRHEQVNLALKAALLGRPGQGEPCP